MLDIWGVQWWNRIYCLDDKAVSILDRLIFGLFLVLVVSCRRARSPWKNQIIQKATPLTAQSTLFVVKLVVWLVGLNLSSMWSCSPTFWDMVGFENFFYCTWLLYVLSRIFGHQYIALYLKCNTHPKKNLVGLLYVYYQFFLLTNCWQIYMYFLEIWLKGGATTHLMAQEFGCSQAYLDMKQWWQVIRVWWQKYWLSNSMKNLGKTLRINSFRGKWILYNSILGK